LPQLRTIEPKVGSLTSPEGFYRHFGNRAEIAGYAGFVPLGWQRGGFFDVEPGVSKG
jgi:transposase